MNKIITIAACLIATALLQSQTIIRVSPTGTGDGTSWQNAGNLEEAISVIERSRASAPLSDRTEIWVQGGTYQPSAMLTVPDSVKVYGGFSGTETMLSQRLVAANPVIVDGQHKIGSIFRLGKAAELHGLTIRNGNANGNSQKNGGGVWADENCVIANCIITNNTATLNGGGIYAKGEVKIINSVVENNVANGSGKNTFGNCLVLGADQSGSGSGVDIVGCNPSILYLGEVNFRSTTTVPITFDGVTLTWSDAVKAEGCNKTWYNGGNSGNYSSDCRANANRNAHGDLFSWCAVARFAHVLCPAPWRVPTREDFFHLDKAMGGNGDGTGPSPNGTPGENVYGKYYYNKAVRNNYLEWNGGYYSGVCDAAGVLIRQGTHIYFWTSLEHSSDFGFSFGLDSTGFIRPQAYYPKSSGHTLRCVK